MQRRSVLLSLSCAGLLLATPLAHAQAGAAAAPAAPDALVLSLSNDVLKTIKADPALAKGDPMRIQKLVDERILPYVDFAKMTQLAAGRAWRTATPQQREALTREFRTLLVRTYSGAVSQVSDHEVQLRPFRGQPGDTDVLVRTNIVASRGDPIQIDYRLENTAGGWKIYDVNILGVWLVENYKTSFASEINAKGLDGLITTLTERNKQLDAAARKV